MNWAVIIFTIAICLIPKCSSSLFESDSCYSFGSGNVFPGGARKVDHKLQFTKAMSMYIIYIKINIYFTLKIAPYSNFLTVSKPAPEWEATAVVNGEIKQLSLSSFKGKYLVFFFYPLDL